MTQRPLALASALAKVWLRAVDEPELVIPGGAQALIRPNATIDGRIQRLLAPSEPGKSGWRMRQTAFNMHVVVFIPLGMMEVACLFFYLQPFIAAVGCHPLALCGR